MHRSYPISPREMMTFSMPHRFRSSFNFTFLPFGKLRSAQVMTKRRRTKVRPQVRVEQYYFVISSAAQRREVRANARRHAGFARNSKTDHRGGDATVFKDRSRVSPPAGDRTIRGRRVLLGTEKDGRENCHGEGTEGPPRRGASWKGQRRPNPRVRW